MPIVGFLSADGVTSDHLDGQGKCSFDFALQLCADGHEAFPYPYPLLKGIRDSIQDRGDYISATSILHCIRAEYLKRTEDFYVSVDSLYPAFRGTLFHSLLEANRAPNARVEEKAVREHRGIEIGGTFDSMLVFQDGRDKKYVIQDWKTTKELPKYGAYTNHKRQVNLYRWLLGLDPKEVRMEIHYFSMVGHKACVLRDGTGPSRGGKAPANEVWTDAEVEAFLDDRLVKLKASFVTGVPLPYDLVAEDEKWECSMCPVKDVCDTRLVGEREAVWRKRAGLPPIGDDSVSVAAEWSGLLEHYRASISDPFKEKDVASAGVSSKGRKTR